ncbi:MAG: T9SS type A sorting domain-containing protein [Bacteroidota bacterium]
MNTRIRLVLVFFFISNFGFSQISKKALFIGNSYTGYNNLAQMVANMASSTGDELIFDAYTPGGARFFNHSSNPTTLSKISSNDWDFVTLQAQSQETSFGWEWKQTELFPYAQILVDSIRSNNECSKPLFYMTWGRENGDNSNCEFIPWVCTYEGMDDTIRSTYSYLAEVHNAAVSPVGAVWRYLRENHPEIDLYTGDGSHPSLAGSYAAACSFYTSIFGKDPALITWNSSLDETTAEIIKTAAGIVAFSESANWDFTVSPSTADFEFVVNGDEVGFTNNSLNYDSLRWSFGDGEESIQVDPTHTYSENGEYSVTLKTWKCGRADSTIQIVEIESALNTITSSDLDFRVYPNPASELISLTFPSRIEKEAVSIRLTDISGRIVLSQSLLTEKQVVDISTLPNGLYLIELSNNQGSLGVCRLVKR